MLAHFDASPTLHAIGTVWDFVSREFVAVTQGSNRSGLVKRFCQMIEAQAQIRTDDEGQCQQTKTALATTWLPNTSHPAIGC